MMVEMDWTWYATEDGMDPFSDENRYIIELYR
jgi:hypothetical protein